MTVQPASAQAGLPATNLALQQHHLTSFCFQSYTAIYSSPNCSSYSEMFLTFAALPLCSSNRNSIHS
jgi:hypothetical protein